MPTYIPMTCPITPEEIVRISPDRDVTTYSVTTDYCGLGKLVVGSVSTADLAPVIFAEWAR